MRFFPLMIGLLAGCAVGPDYQRPEAPAAPQFKEAQGWREAQPKDQLPRGSWWSVFGDAELDRLMQRVEVSNQNIRLAEARLRQARGVADQARAGLFPVVSANASGIRTKSPSLANQPNFANGAVDNYAVGLTANWDLDLWGRVRRSVEAGEDDWQASAAQLEAARLSARATLAQNYFALRVADTTQRLLDDTVKAYQRSLELTQNRYQAGVAARVDVVQAQAKLKSAQAQLIDIRLERAQLEHAIALQLGDVPANFSLEKNELAINMPQIPLALPSELLERRPDIAAAERAMAAANAQIGVARAAYFPTLSLSTAVGYRGTDYLTLFVPPGRFWSLGVSAAEALFDGGQRGALADQAAAAYDAQVATYRQTVLTGYQEVEDNLAALRILEEEAAAQNDAAQAARRALELTLNQYAAGVVSYLNVITAQTSALANERAAVNVLGRRLTASVGLVRALGGGWTADQIARR